MNLKPLAAVILTIAMLAVMTVSLQAALHPMEPQPDVVSVPEGKAPSDAIVLFDGSGLSEWSDNNGEPSKWIIKDSAMIVNKGGIRTKREFGDIQLHIEFATPTPPEGEGQGRGNSGVYLAGRYEVQVLDSYKNDTYIDGMCGALYENSIPLVNACRPPGQWQTYDIIFRSPEFDSSGNKTQQANVTVLHNGVLIQDHAFTNVTPGGVSEEDSATGPIFMQDHGNPVRYRNVWVREL